MTGRGMGFCATGTPGGAPMGFGGRGRGFGCGYGRGYGYSGGAGYGGGGRRFGAWGGAFPAFAPEENLEAMKQVARNLESELEAVRARIDALQKE